MEAAWAYRHAPAVRGKLKERLAGQDPGVVAYSWAAQCRLNTTYRRLAARKGPHTAVDPLKHPFVDPLDRPVRGGPGGDSPEEHLLAS